MHCSLPFAYDGTIISEISLFPPNTQDKNGDIPFHVALRNQAPVGTVRAIMDSDYTTDPIFQIKDTVPLSDLKLCLVVCPRLVLSRALLFCLEICRWRHV